MMRPLLLLLLVASSICLAFPFISDGETYEPDTYAGQSPDAFLIKIPSFLQGRKKRSPSSGQDLSIVPLRLHHEGGGGGDSVRTSPTVAPPTMRSHSPSNTTKYHHSTAGTYHPKVYTRSPSPPPTTPYVDENGEVYVPDPSSCVPETMPDAKEKAFLVKLPKGSAPSITLTRRQKKDIWPFKGDTPLKDRPQAEIIKELDEASRKIKEGKKIDKRDVSEAAAFPHAHPLKLKQKRDVTPSADGSDSGYNGHTVPELKTYLLEVAHNASEQYNKEHRGKVKRDVEELDGR